MVRLIILCTGERWKKNRTLFEKWNFSWVTFFVFEIRYYCVAQAGLSLSNDGITGMNHHVPLWVAILNEYAFLPSDVYLEKNDHILTCIERLNGKCLMRCSLSTVYNNKKHRKAFEYLLIGYWFKTFDASVQGNFI